MFRNFIINSPSTVTLLKGLLGGSFITNVVLAQQLYTEKNKNLPVSNTEEIVEKKLTHIYNFKHQQVFPDITTYPVMALFTNSQASPKFNYSVVELRNDSKEEVNLISTTELD